MRLHFTTCLWNDGRQWKTYSGDMLACFNPTQVLNAGCPEIRSRPNIWNQFTANRTRSLKPTFRSLKRPWNSGSDWD